MSSRPVKREEALDQSPDARKRMGLVMICVCAFFSVLQIDWAGRVGCGECGTGGARQVWQETCRGLFPFRRGSTGSHSGGWGSSEQQGRLSGTAAKPPDCPLTENRSSRDAWEKHTAFLPRSGLDQGHSLTLQTGQPRRMRGRGRRARTISQVLWVLDPDHLALPRTSCVTLGKWPHLSVPHFFI